MFFSRLTASILLLCCLLGASSRTDNFIVNASSEGVARQFAQVAEAERVRISEYWLGRQLPRWTSPCLIFVYPHEGKFWGESSMLRGKVNAYVYLHGPITPLLQNVLPHELCHVILFSELGDMQSWASEGAAIAMESIESRDQLLEKARVHMINHGNYSLTWMVNIPIYPDTDEKIQVFYRQTAAFSTWILEKGPTKYLELSQPVDDSNKSLVLSKALGYPSINECEQALHAWLMNKQNRAPPSQAALASQPSP